MATTILPLSINFGEKLATVCMSDEVYDKIKDFLFIDGNNDPRVVGLSIVNPQAYMTRLERQKASAKITQHIIEPKSL